MNGQRSTLLDCAFKLLDDVRSPQDFTLILYFRNPPPLAALEAGARSAREHYPTSGSRSEVCISGSLDRFVNDPFDLRDTPPVKQMFVADRACLVTRFHHAAADGLSAALWLGHQLSVAYGLPPPDSSADLSLRRAASSVRRSAFAYEGACDPLWTTNTARTGKRRWITFSFPAKELQRACRRAGGFTYSDLLATCALEVLSEWNRCHIDNAQPRIGLWLPMNIRARSFAGFGNGTSRIRVYARYPRDVSLIEKAREIRRQVSWTTTHGEWAVPEIPLFTRLPAWITAPFLRSYLNRPSVDMATAVFSHADRWAGEAREAFKEVERIECVGVLHARQKLALNAATHQGHTWMTFTYDAGVLPDTDAEQLVRIFEQQIESARECLL